MAIRLEKETHAPLLEAKNGHGMHDGIILYRRRWWILGLYSLFAMLQGWQWGVPGGIANSLQTLYNIDGFTIQILLAYGPIFYLPFTIPFAWWLDQRDGLRGTTLCGLFLCLAGAILRCVAISQSTWSIACMHLGYVLNAIAGPVSMGCVSKLAEHWFPASERGMATAIAAEANLMGAAVAFAVGPAMLPDSSVSQNLYYNVLVAGLFALNTAGCLLYYPSRPPHPPSISASGHSHEAAFTLAALRTALLRLACNRNFVVLALSYGLCNGMASSWGSTLELNLSLINVDQTMAGWIGFAATISGNLGGLVLGRLVDSLRYHKAVVVACMALSALLYGFFSAVAQQLLPASVSGGQAVLVQVFVAATAGGFFLNSIIPVMFELAVENTYPAVPEGLVIMVMTFVNNAGSLILLFIPITNAAAAFFNWGFVGTIVMCTVLMLALFYDNSARFKVDVGLSPEPADEAAGAGTRPLLSADTDSGCGRSGSVVEFRGIFSGHGVSVN